MGRLRFVQDLGIALTEYWKVDHLVKVRFALIFRGVSGRGVLGCPVPVVLVADVPLHVGELGRCLRHRGQIPFTPVILCSEAFAI